MEFKKATIKYAQENSIHSAAKKFKVVRKRVLEWVQKEGKVTSMKGKRFRLDGGGRKLTDVELEEEVLGWIQQHVGICYVLLESLSRLKLNLFMMKNVATMKS